MTTEVSAFPVALPFSPEEFAARRERILAQMQRQKLDAIVLTSAPNYYYAAGLSFQVILGLMSLVLRSDGRGFWIGRRTEMGNVQSFIAAAGWSEIARGIADEEDTFGAAGEALAKLVPAGARVGFELDARTIPYSGIVTMAAAVPGLEIANASPIVEGLRAVKTAAELDALNTSAQMTARVIKGAVSKIVEGQTDTELALNIFAGMAAEGSDPLPCVPFVTAGPRSALAHSTYANIPINRGELITVETGAVYKKYCAPTYRIAMIGQPSDDLRRLHDASRDALLAALEKFGPGITSHEGDRIVRESIERSGYLDYFTVRAAYSIGLGFSPSWDEDHIMKLRPNDDRVVQPGMVFHVVPALYKPGAGAVCCSNTVQITENGAKAMVPVEAELLVV